MHQRVMYPATLPAIEFRCVFDGVPKEHDVMPIMFVFVLAEKNAGK